MHSYIHDNDDVRVDECMGLCRQYNVNDALALLYERRGDFIPAYEIIFQVSIVLWYGIVWYGMVLIAF